MKNILIAFVSALLCTTVHADNFASEIISNFNQDKEEYSIKFGGWSHHSNTLTKKVIKKYQNKDFKYNENHTGIGFEYAIPYKNSNHYFMTGAWYMKDSFGMDAFHAGLGYKYKYDLGFKYLDSIDFNLVLTYFNRSKIDSYNRPYSIVGVNKDGNVTSKTDHLEKDIFIIRTDFILPAPYLTFNISKNAHIDTMMLLTPAKYSDLTDQGMVITKEYESVFFIRAGFTF